MSISDITINGKQNTTKQVMQNIEYILNGHSDIDFNTKIQEKRRNSHQSILNNSLYHNNSQNLNQCQERQHLQNSNMEIEVQNLKQRLSTMEKDNFQQLNQKDQDEKKIYQIRNNQQGVNINQRLNNLQSFYEQKIAILEDKIIELEQENDLINKEKIYFEKQCQNKQIQLENIQQQLYEELKQVFEEQQNERKFENEREKIIMTQQYNELYDKFVKLQDDFLFKFNILNEEKIQLKENTIQAMKKQIKSIQEDTEQINLNELKKKCFMQQQLVQLNDNQSLLINTQRQDRIDKISRQLSLLNKEEDYQDFDLKKVLQKKRNQILEQNEEFKTLCDKNYKDVQKEIQKSVSVKRAKLVAESKKKSAPKFVQNSRNPISKQLEQDLKKINRLITQNIDFISTKKPQSAKRIRG